MTGRRPIASLSAPRNGPKTKCRTEPMAPGMTVKWSKSSSWVMGQSPKFGVAQKIMVNTKTSQTSGAGSLEL